MSLSKSIPEEQDILALFLAFQDLPRSKIFLEILEILEDFGGVSWKIVDFGNLGNRLIGQESISLSQSS